MRTGYEESHSQMIKVCESISLTLDNLYFVINSLHFTASCTVIKVITDSIKMIFDCRDYLTIKFGCFG